MNSHTKKLVQNNPDRKDTMLPNSEDFSSVLNTDHRNAFTVTWCKISPFVDLTYSVARQ
jgi:hypothetical protein